MNLNPGSALEVTRWTAKQLVAWMSSLSAWADRERAIGSANNGKLIQLDQAARRISDPARRAQVLAWIASSVRRQVAIARGFREFGQKWGAFSSRVRSWLNSTGLVSEAQGLGAVAPLAIPAALAALVLVAWAAVAYLSAQNRQATAAINYHAKALEALQEAGATPAQLATFIADSEAAIHRLAPTTPDPLGLVGLAEKLLPLALLAIVGVVIAKRIPQKAGA